MRHAEDDGRIAIWWAMSELFLDTRLDIHDYLRIAASLNRSGLRKEELWQILDREVGPALSFNLVDIAGEWAGFHPDEVARMVVASPWWLAILGRLQWRGLLRRQLKRDWERRIAPLLGPHPQVRSGLAGRPVAEWRARHPMPEEPAKGLAERVLLHAAGALALIYGAFIVLAGVAADLIAACLPGSKGR